MDDNGQDPGHLSRRERTRQQHREEILSAATGLFARHGYDGTSMQMIADQAEISVGKLYLHFEGKEDIYREIAEYHAGKMRAMANEASDPSMPPIERIRMRNRAVTRYLDENADFVRFYVSEMEGMGKCARCEDDSDHKTHFSEISDLFREAIERGDIPDEDPDILTAMIHGAGHGLIASVVERGTMQFVEIADCIDRLILKPLEDRKLEEKRKEGGG
ncbi:MAG: TetR/AcrR family transcriptional regulator [Candidatus Krumholzibacteria bacterium]|nr:TetR/AcrR family transcriptional regulator [Candidatus Krumholzibacteria bacterium]